MPKDEPEPAWGKGRRTWVIFVLLRQSSAWCWELLERELVLGLGGKHVEVCTKSGPRNSSLYSPRVFWETKPIPLLKLAFISPPSAH